MVMLETVLHKNSGLLPKSERYIMLLCILALFPGYMGGEKTARYPLLVHEANQTSATFLRVCGSKLIQKYLVRTVMFVSCCVIQANKIHLVLQSLHSLHVSLVAPSRMGYSPQMLVLTWVSGTSLWWY